MLFRSGTAISIVTPIDQKSMVAIEKLTGQTIPLAEGGAAIQPSENSVDASEGSTERPREPRTREGSRGGRKPRREREPRRDNAGRGSSPQPQAPTAAFAPPAKPPASRTPSIGRAEAAPPPRDAASEPADHSHLPAFLLRPVRARV